LFYPLAANGFLGTEQDQQSPNRTDDEKSVFPLQRRQIFCVSPDESGIST
jgi:hypothetical protein